MSRGNARQEIFLNAADCRHFLGQLARALRRFGALCHAYCLMPNHFHLILRATETPLARTMHQLNSAYATWFNARHDRVGHLLQGRPKMFLIEDGGYFRRALRYVARNPVRAELAADPAAWHWSSYRSTAGLSSPRRWLALDAVWAEFGDHPDVARQAYAAYCADEDFVGPEAALASPLVFGSAACAAGLRGHLGPHRADRESVYAERFGDRPSLGELFAAADGDAARQEVTRRAFDDHGYTLREIADHLGVAPTTVWRHARGVVRHWRTVGARRKRSRSDPIIHSPCSPDASS